MYITQAYNASMHIIDHTFCAKHTFHTFCRSFGKILSESTVILYEYFDKCNNIKVLNLTKQ